MSYTIGDTKNDIAGIAHGRSANKITNYNSAARRAAMNVLRMLDPEETIRSALITLYDGVSDYAVPVTDLKEKKVIDLRPQTSRKINDNLSNRLSKDFDLKKEDNWFSVETDSGTKYIRVSKKLAPGSVGIDPLDDTAKWAASGSASNLAEDTIYTVDDGNSLSFDLTTGSDGMITSSVIGPIDLTAELNVGGFFVWVYMPQSSTDISTFKLRIGSSAAAYWQMTGVIHRGSARQGWNLIRFDWGTATKVSVPTITAISYAQLILTPGAASVTGFRIDKLFCSIPRIWEMWYYSKFLFLNGTTWQATVSNDDTVINLDETSYIIYLNELALAALQQIQGKDAIADRTYIYKQLYGDGQNMRGLYAEYRKDNPDQAEPVTRTYYTNTRYKRK